MAKFSKQSKERLETCDVRLQNIFNKVIDIFDCSVIVGHRNKAEQNMAYKAGKSKLKYPESKHNKKPSLAVDVAPYPINYNLKSLNNLKRWYYFAGVAKGIAYMLNINIRWGGDWDSDTDFADQTFNDLAHFEIK
jgi:peptidoglycan L-alanyl-D-glutamate endopeptidase CwlK